MKIARSAIVLLLLAVVVAGGLLFWGWRELRRPVVHKMAQEYIEIPRGSTPAEIVARLAAAGIVRRAWLLNLYIRVTRSGNRLKAGEYRFSSPISPLAVLDKLEEGQQRLSRFTVVEGWARWDIAAAMARLPDLDLNDSAEALSLMNDTSLIQDIDPEAANLEGYLYPDTYSFPPQTTARAMIAAMVRRFRRTWDEGGLAERARTLDKTPREIVTIASLIETEAKLEAERPLVSSVIYNRLKLNIPLGIDSTVIYASKLAGKWRNDGKVYQSDLDRPSSYNTRKTYGLPPGPVASPGESSLRAAVNPAVTDFIFYVRDPARDDGAHNFYATETEFQRGVQALRAWEKARDARAAALKNGETQQ